MRNPGPRPARGPRVPAAGAVAAVVALPLLAGLPPGPAEATAKAALMPAARPAASDGWISQISWTSRPVAPGVTVRAGVSRSPAEQVREAIINPRLARVEVTHHGIVARRQTTSSVAAATGALVATNGGFFITSGRAGFPGAPDGLAVYGGQLESMNNGPRAALIIAGGRPRIADAEAFAAVTRAGQSSYPVNGINRVPGTVEDCGRPGSRPTSRPRQDVTCTVRSELVLFTSQFGAATPHGPGTQAVLNSAGTVLSAGRRAGGRVPAAGWVIQGIGAAGAWLRRYAIRGRHLSISERLADTAGHAIPLTQGLSVGSAAPILVSRSRVAIDADREGVTLAEEAALMLSLGAVSAMNLDGGGSTAMAVQGQLVSRPSDGAERADGDFVVVRP